METLRKYGAKYNTTFCSFAGLSTDTKPVGTVLIDDKSVVLANGSEFIEMDTNKKYLYDAENQQWNLASSGGGGGGGTLSFERINTVIPDFSPTTGYYGIAYAQIVNNSSDEVTLSYEDGNEIFIVINPVKRLNMIPNSVGGVQVVIFTATDDFVGIYNTSTSSKINFSEAPIGNGKATTVTMDYRNADYFLTNNYGNFDMFFNIVE